MYINNKNEEGSSHSNDTFAGCSDHCAFGKCHQIKGTCSAEDCGNGK